MEPRRRFRFLKQLSEGTFGKVYMAEMITDNNFSSVVAIKLLHGKWLGHEEIVQRSRDEARVLGLLHHRNIIRVEDLTSLNGQCAVIMEYLDGVDLKSLINYCVEHKRRIPRRVVFELVAATASALEAAYYREPLRGGEALNLIHRDIKPSNVMVTVAGDIKVLDFGTAQARFENREAQTQALAFGSQAYMAPERLLGDPDAPSGDVFSLGVTLFELLTLEPFGKIHIRPERYDASHAERMARLDLSDLDETRAQQIRDTLDLLLKYEATERPDARQVLDLLEALSEEIHDGSLRRFCREVVGPCRDALTGGINHAADALANSTLFEDVSGLRGDWAGQSAAQPPVSDPGTIDPEPASTGGADTGYTDGAVHTSDPPKPPASSTMPLMGGRPEPADVPPEPDVARSAVATIIEEPTQEESIPDPSSLSPQVSSTPPPAGDFARTISPAIGKPPVKKPVVTPPPQPEEPPAGGLGRWIIIGLLLVVVLGGGSVAVVVGFINNTDPPVEQTPPEPPAVPDAPASEGIPGQRVVIGDVGPDAGTVILKVQGPGVVSVKLNEASGDFEQVWDGSNELELVGLPAGVYRTRIKAESTERATIDSVPEKTCRYTFTVGQGASEWESDCE